MAPGDQGESLAFWDQACAVRRVLKYRVVLKLLILLQTRLHPVTFSGLIHEGKGFRMDWNAFMLGGRGGTEGG